MDIVACGPCDTFGLGRSIIARPCSGPDASRAGLYINASLLHGLECRAVGTSESNGRWAMDVTPIPCGQNGWGPLTAVMDGHDRDLSGYEFALRGRAQEAERAIEAAYLTRFGTRRPVGSTPVLRSDNG